MIDIEEENRKPVSVYLVGRCEDRAVSDRDVLRELSSLAETAGLTPAGGTVLRRYEPSPKFGMGAGKASELIESAKSADAEQIVFDFEITPSQQRNWEKESGLTCLDRQEVIIKIFAARALTREAVLQVELKSPAALGNKGGLITLLDPDGLKVHGVAYTQARCPGRLDCRLLSRCRSSR